MADAEYLGAGTIPGRLYVSGLPYFKRGTEGRVHGELYRVSDTLLARLDQFEGYNKSNPDWSFYNRVNVPASWIDSDGDNAEGSVYAYEFNGHVHTDDLSETGEY